MSTTLQVVVDGMFRQGRHNLAVNLVAENGQPLPCWQPGAHIDVHLREGLVRQYSLTGQSDNTRHYQICIARDQQSRGGSRYVHEMLRPGQVLRISPPRNLFPMQPAGKVILMAAGIGITPLYAMAEALEAAGVPFVLHYYVKQRGDEAFLPELSKPFQHGFCEIWHSSEGRSPRSHAPAELLDPAEDTHLYLCGPAGFMSHIRATAIRHGWQEQHIHTEAFKPLTAVAAQGEAGFTVTLASTGQQWPVAPGQTIATVLLENGVDVPLSCEMGMCGACLTRVTEGEIDHRDTVQSAAEKSAPEQYIALCCSRSLSRNLVIEL
ncbi:MAG: PDR/VanB family oxidoreductase [Pantoea sp.]|uniref:PDR/VanB family oxidoreductase n=1 Tax=Pantoea sp. TaxID=69393 RepID=UPI0039E443D8